MRCDACIDMPCRGTCYVCACARVFVHVLLFLLGMCWVFEFLCMFVCVFVLYVCV
jgi:hypothetical protein